MYVDAVGDDRGNCGTRSERGGDDSGIPMVQRAHRVEQMREHPRAGVDAGIGLLEGRVGMADGNDHVARGEFANRVECAGQLGRQRDQSKRAHREHSLEGVAMRLEIKRGMRAEAVRRDERAFKMHPENGGAVGGVIACEFSNAVAIES